MAFLRKILLATIAFLYMQAVGHLRAQSIDINLDKKVIYTDSLNLPRQTTAKTVLSMMSELLQRPGVVVYSNYDIKVNGMSVSDASDVALANLDIQDVEKIEISESPTSSYQKNGQGGSINLVLRQQDTDDNGIWGSAGVDVTYPSGIAPQVHIGHRSKKFYISGLALSDIYNNNNKTENLAFVDDKIQSVSVKNFDEKYRSLLANVLMEYSPDSRNLFKFNLSESYAYGEEITVPNYDVDQTRREEYKTTNLRALVSYKHSFNRSTLNLEAQYNYRPDNHETFIPQEQQLWVHQDKQALGGKVEYSANLQKPSSPYSLKLAIGSNFNFTFANEDLDYIDLKNNQNTVNEIDPVNNTGFVQPFMSLEAKFGQFRMKAQGEFQHYRYDMSKFEDSFSTTSNDITGQVIVEWHFKPNQMFRLFGARALQRPSENAMFPVKLYYPSNMLYVKGNANLLPELTHEIRLDYVSDLRWGEHLLHYDVNMSYKHVNDMIESVMVGGGTSTGGFGLVQQYLTYINEGRNNIVSGNIMAMYSYKSFAVSLTGNIFHNKQNMHSVSDHYTYYNISLSPHFILKDGWQGSFGVIYNSPVETDNQKLSDCTQVSTIIGKRWNNLYMFCFTNQALHKEAKDVNWSDNVRNEKKYEMIPNMAGVGLKYIF